MVENLILHNFILSRHSSCYYWKRVSTPLRGGFYRYFTQFIEQFLLTHDRAWYELACQMLPDNRWKRVELFAVRVGDYEKPVVREDLPHLAVANRFLAQGHIKAAAVHVRTEFEIGLKRACEKFRLKVPYKANPLDLTGVICGMW